MTVEVGGELKGKSPATFQPVENEMVTTQQQSRIYMLPILSERYPPPPIIARILALPDLLGTARPSDKGADLRGCAKRD